MALHRSLDEKELIAALFHDVHTLLGTVFNNSSLTKTLKKIDARLSTEGISFLTKTLPRLGKAFDKALAEDTPLNASKLRFTPLPGSKLPRFLGELFSRVLKPDGTVLQEPCNTCVGVIRDVCYLYYKYELPYADEQRQQVIAKFERTEQDLSTITDCLDDIRAVVENANLTYRSGASCYASGVTSTGTTCSQRRFEVAREARVLLSRLFASFEPEHIYPRHGPGAVATKQQLWGKYLWTNVSARITEMYPLDAYFYASLGHICDSVSEISLIDNQSLPARVILVPKDSRGPRLISCEPVDYQWVQQGLGRAIVELVENSELTKFNVFFTDQQPNQFGALLGSKTGRYATLDLNEASDRVSVALVHLLFPSHIYEFLNACRSLSTVLPNGKVLPLKKFAPMGSCLCFPIMALTIWAILTAGATDKDTREGILVYGDDVIVPTAFAGDAIELLESFGLKINRDKSCIRGFFRESCGTDAFKGVNVTPVRLRTVWSSSRSPDSYASWMAYANSFYHKKYFHVYDYIVEALTQLYGSLPTKDQVLNTCPSLPEVPSKGRIRSRWNSHLQRREFHVLTVKSPVVRHVLDGWSSLLRYFAEKGNDLNHSAEMLREKEENDVLFAARRKAHLRLGGLLFTRPSLLTDRKGYLPLEEEPFDVSSYTRRRSSMLVRRWR